MSDEKALIIRQPSALAHRPARGLLALSPRQMIVPAAGAALALTWGAGKLARRLWSNRQQITPVQPAESPAVPAQQPGQTLLIYRATWTITVIGKREHDTR